MNALRRRSREVYRLYSEEDYLEAAELPLLEVVEAQTPDRPQESRGGSWQHHSPGADRLRRIGALALLAAVVGALGWLVGLSALRVARASSSKRLARSSSDGPRREPGTAEIAAWSPSSGPAQRTPPRTRSSSLARPRVRPRRSSHHARPLASRYRDSFRDGPVGAPVRTTAVQPEADRRPSVAGVSQRAEFGFEDGGGG
jgi:hypothetical protein